MTVASLLLRNERLRLGRYRRRCACARAGAGDVKALSVDLSSVCRSVGVPYLAVFDAMAGNVVWTREAAIGDGTHPNGGGYAALACVILAWNGWRAWFNE